MVNGIVKVTDQSGNPIAGAFVSGSIGCDNHGCWLGQCPGPQQGSGTTDANGEVWLFTSIPSNPWGGCETWSGSVSVSGQGLVATDQNVSTGQIGTSDVTWGVAVTTIPSGVSTAPGSQTYVNAPTINWASWGWYIGGAILAVAISAALIYYRRQIWSGLKGTGQKVSQGARRATTMALMV